MCKKYPLTSMPSFGLRRGFWVGGFPPTLLSLTLLSFLPALLPFTAPMVSKLLLTALKLGA